MGLVRTGKIFRQGRNWAIARRLPFIRNTAGDTEQGQVVQHSQATQTTNFLNRHRHSGIQLAGFFIFVGLLAAVGAVMHYSDAHASSTPATNMQSPGDSTTSPLLPSQDPAPTSEAPAASTASGNNNSSSSKSTDTSTTLNNDNGASSAQVTVNGQPIAVPANGSVQGTVGNTTYSVSHNQDNTGNAQNITDFTTTSNVSSNSSSVVTQETGNNQ